MTKVDFYILPSADPSARLDFACKLTEKAWRMGHRIYLHCSDAAQRDDLDARLWAFKGESFVPHGPAESEPDGLIVLGLGDDCGQHQDLLVNLDLKVPAFAKQVRPRGGSGGGRSDDSFGCAGEFPFLPRTGLSSARSPFTATLSIPMDTPKPQQKSAHLLDDLESIRQLLGDDNLQPPLLTDTVEEGDQEQIPMLFDTVGASPPIRSNRHHPPLLPSRATGACRQQRPRRPAAPGRRTARRRAIDHARRDRRLRPAHRNRNQTPARRADGTVVEPVRINTTIPLWRAAALLAKQRT